MMTASPERLSSVIAGIYDTVLEPDLWTRVLPSIADIFDSQQAALNVLDGSGRTVLFNALHGLGTEDLTLFRAFVAVDDTPQWWQIAPTDRPSLRSSISPDREFALSPYYNEVIRPSGSFYALLAPVTRSAESHVDLFVARETSSKDYDAGHLATMQLLMSHVRRSIDLYRKLATRRSLASALTHLPFGIIFVDPGLRVIDMNETAETMVTHPHYPLRVKSRVMSMTDRKNQAALQRLVASACSVNDGVIEGVGGDISVRPGPNNHVRANISISVAPLPDPHAHDMPHERCAVLFVREISFDVAEGLTDQIRDFFKLTSKEAALATSLVAGRTLKQAAEDNNIQFNTARGYLETIFDKTETRQQSQLVLLLKSLQPLVRR